MSEHGNEDSQSLPLENFLQSSPRTEIISMDVKSCLEIGGSQICTSDVKKFRSSSTLTVCPSPQLAPSPQSSSRSVPPNSPPDASPSSTQPTSPAMVPSLSHPGVISNWPASQTSPRQFLSDSESSCKSILGKRGHNLLLKRSLSTTPTKSSCRTFKLNSLAQRRPTAHASQPHHSYNDHGRRNASLSSYSLQYMDVNHNVVPESLHLLTSQNQSAQRHFLSPSPSTRSNSNLEPQWSQECLPAINSPNISSPGAVGSPLIPASFKQLQDGTAKSATGLRSDSSMANHSPGQSSSPKASHSLDSNPATKNTQIPLSFAQSYSNLTPWTTRLANDSSNSFININDEGLQLSLGISDNLLLSASAKENQPETQQNYGSIHQPYSSLWQEATDSDESPKPVKETYKVLPNKQLRFRKTADALQKSGLWEVAMKTGNLIRRNKELQKELDKFRADALVFLKSVIKNPHNWKLIKTILSQALASNQAASKASPIMTVVVSAAEAAVVAASKLDSAGSSDFSTGSSLNGNASDSSGSNSSAFDTTLVENHFVSSKNDFSVACVEMDVN